MRAGRCPGSVVCPGSCGTYVRIRYLVQEDGAVMSDGLMQIGEVADKTGLSLRTIRYYEEVGIVVPSARSQGGFRLYTDADVERLQLAKKMKPLEFTLDQMRELLAIIDRLASSKGLPASEKTELSQRLSFYERAVAERRQKLREQLETAEGFASMLAKHRKGLPQQPKARTGARG